MYDALTDSQFENYFTIGAQLYGQPNTESSTIAHEQSMTIEQGTIRDNMDKDQPGEQGEKIGRSKYGGKEPYIPPHGLRGDRQEDRDERDGPYSSPGLYSSDLYDSDPHRYGEERGARGERKPDNESSPSVYTSSPDEAKPKGRFGRESPLPSTIGNNEKDNDRELARKMQEACIEESERVDRNMFGRRIESENRVDRALGIGKSKGQANMGINMMRMIPCIVTLVVCKIPVTWGR